MDYIKNQTLEEIPEYIETETIKRIDFSKPDFTEDVINENLLDNWTIDDFLLALPESIKYGIDDNIYGLNFNYNTTTSSWNIYYYNSENQKSIFKISNIDPYECFKEIYSKLKIIDKI